jgi:dTMP kinase
MRGRFITLEGGEGTGKSSHAKLLAHRLQSHGIDTVLTREPGGSPAAEIIRHVILTGAAKPFGADAEAMLFAAARGDHLDTTIRPALERSAWVVCDRFADSTRVYQGVLGGIDRGLIRALERITIGRDRPDLTIVLDVPAELGLQRAAKRRGGEAADRFEAEGVDFHARLREAFLGLAAEEPDRCVVVDTAKPRHDVADEIWRVVQERLRPLGDLSPARQAAL